MNTPRLATERDHRSCVASMMMRLFSMTRSALALLLAGCFTMQAFAAEIVWTVVDTAPRAPVASASISYGGQVYFVGGIAGGEGECGGVGRDLSAFNPASATWDDRARLPECAGVARPALASSGGSIYAIGGDDPNGSGFRSGIHRYIPAADRWVANVATIPGDDGGSVLHSVVDLDGAIYMFGGLAIDFEGNFDLRREALRFDRRTQVVAEISAMPRERYAMHSGNGGAYLMNDEIWIVGGFDDRFNLQPIDVYNPEKDVWENSRATPPIGGSTAKLGDHLYLFGKDLAATYRYLPGADSWVALPVTFDVPDGFDRIGEVTVVGTRFHAVGYREGDVNAAWTLRGELIDGDDVRLGVSPGDGLLTSRQRVNIVLSLELGGNRGTTVTWNRILIDGRDRTAKLLAMAVPGTLPGGGHTLLLPERPISLVKRLGAGEHTFHVEAEIDGEVYTRTVLWRCFTDE